MTIDEKIQAIETSINLLQGMLKELKIERIHAQWMKEEKELRKEFPSFDLYEEMHDDHFAKYLTLDYTVRDAYLKRLEEKEELIGSVERG